jgi:acetyl-CoA C-acetyltransferase
MPEAVIVDAVRTPVGRAFKGSLASLRPDETLAFVVDQLLERNPGVDPTTVEELIAGCGLPQGLQANNIARIAVLLSEKLTQTTNGLTVSRYCASGLDAIRNAANAVVADKYGVSREDQDRYAQRSQERAVAAQEAGVFDREIVPVTLADGTVVSKDDGPRASSTYEKLATLEPAFKPGGTVTAGNSCPLNDGAAAAIIMSADKAKELGLKPRARIITAATWGNEPEYMGVAPIGAIKKALDRAGMSASDIDITELNEAFAAQVLPIASEVGIDLDNLNPHGGAIALGHPFGMTGVRIMTTLINDLETLDKTIGLETMCVAQGQGEALIIERLN